MKRITKHIMFPLVFVCSVYVQNNGMQDDSKAPQDDMTQEERAAFEARITRLDAIFKQYEPQTPEEKLLDASSRGDEAEVIRLLDQDVNPNVMTQHNSSAFYERTPLMKAAERGHSGVVQIFIDRHIDVDFRRPGDETALMLASLYGFDVVVDQLLKTGADVNARDGAGSTALIKAAAATFPGEPSTVIARLLAVDGIKVDAKNREGRTALMEAVKTGNLETVRMLLDAGANVLLHDADGKGVLNLAVEMSFIKEFMLSDNSSDSDKILQEIANAIKTNLQKKDEEAKKS